MSDTVDAATRSAIMSRVGTRDTKPELMLRHELHSRGIRYRLNVKALPGTPDIVLPKWRAIIFVHGCFWHRHAGCKKTTSPKNNATFWSEKFEANVARDKTTLDRLHARNWRTLVVWECAIGRTISENLIDFVLNFLRGTEIHASIGRDELSTLP